MVGAGAGAGGGAAGFAVDVRAPEFCGLVPAGFWPAVVPLAVCVAGADAAGACAGVAAAV
jgi:hypothetical protein